MKIKSRTLIPLFVLVLLALSAVGVASAQNFSDLAGTIRSAVIGQSASETEITGTITSITPESWTVDGTEFSVLPQTEVKGAFVVGDVVKVHLFSAADGSLTAREIEYAQTGVADNNGNDNGAIDDDNGNVNDNANGEIEDDNGNVNDNANGEIDDGNVNDNTNGEIDDGNVNDNANGAIDDDNGNVNDNANGEIDDDNGNMNGNDNGGINQNDNGNANDDNGGDHHGGDDNGGGNHGGDDQGGGDHGGDNGDSSLGG